MKVSSNCQLVNYGYEFIPSFQIDSSSPSIIKHVKKNQNYKFTFFGRQCTCPNSSNFIPSASPCSTSDLCINISLRLYFHTVTFFQHRLEAKISHSNKILCSQWGHERVAQSRCHNTSDKKTDSTQNLCTCKKASCIFVPLSLLILSHSFQSNYQYLPS